MTFEEAKKIIYELDSGSGFFGRDYESGFSDALNRVLGILDEVDTEPVVKDKLTLTELARELRKVFKFKYLTCDNGSEVNDLCLWMDLPLFKQGEWFGQSSDSIKMFVEVNTLSVDLDLSEYKDADGNIDYSKCIVEVE